VSYLLYLAAIASIYAILTLSLNLVVGHCGRLSLCHASIAGVGSYLYALSSVGLQVPFLGAFAIAVIGGALASLVVGLPSLRLEGDYFVLATLGFQMVIHTSLHSWTSVTRGSYGIPGIPRPSLLGWEATSPASQAGFVVLVLGISVIAFHRLTRSPYGRALRAVREDGVAAACLGKNAFGLQLSAFVIAGGFAAAAGALYASYVTYIDPSSFTVGESVVILAAVVLGGAASLRGALLGAALIVFLPEAFRFLPLPESWAPELRQVFFGAALILLMRFRPQGVCGEYALD